eukprot:CAMPEP_0119155620 /NCGR_PEP_ID=MMETSP1310-20130426/51840_1 /TAXON_ID=464262 /ORGANISM="Genus nov. species nov., Strain RCC2339" /LENGTH=169 /DNA_ID=CAMNT_0007148219 /DNA_START=80 /DNA_END=586 /DNA_ORIENTATION=+
MSKRKGLSMEEKRERMLKFILDSKSLWTVQELEKTLPKKCGIVSQSVKEVLEGLEADGLVCNDKVGVKQLYWSFPSDAVVKLEKKYTVLSEGNAAKRRKIEALSKEETKLQGSREDEGDREGDLAKHGELTEENTKLKAELGELQKHDPSVIAEKEEKSKKCVEAINRW